MIRSFLTVCLATTALAVTACTKEEAPELIIEETPVEAPLPTPDPGKIAMETADSLEAYQTAAREGQARACTWVEKDGKPVPQFYRNATIQKFFEDLQAVAAEDEAAADAKIAELDAEFSDCVTLSIPRAEDTGAPQAIDLNATQIFQIDGRYEGMAENMFRLVDRYAHPITYVCPVQVDKGSRVLIAYKTDILTSWSGNVEGALSTHLDNMFPDNGSSVPSWTLDSATADEITACRDAYLALTAKTEN